MTTLSEHTTTTGATEAGPGTARGDVAVVAGATLAAVVTWALWTQAGGVELAARAGGEVRQIEAATVAVSTLILAALGVLVLRLLEARSARGLRWWTMLASAVCVLSMGGPLGGTTPAAVLGLVSLHVVVGVCVVLGARRVRRGR